jgi:predicted dehydrogenase
MPSAAIIGGGYGSRMLVPALRSAGIDVAAICSRNADRAAEAARRLDIAKWMNDVSELVDNSDVDLVCVASPPALHQEHVLAAINAGKNVLCEKPMALNTAQAREMYDAAERVNVVHAIDHEFRFLPVRARVAQVLQSGALGEVRMVDVVEHSTRLQDSSTPESSWWLSREQGGGHLGAIGSHWIDTLLWWLGPVSTVSSELAAHVPSRPTYHSSGPVAMNADDSAALMLRFESGALATLAFTAVATHESRRATIIGSKGRVEIVDNGQLRIEWQDGSVEARSYSSTSSQETQPGQMAALVSLLEAVGRRVTGELAAPSFPTFEDGVRVQAILDQAYYPASKGLTRGK